MSTDTTTTPRTDVCPRCDATFATRDGDEPSLYCDGCAHEMVDELQEARDLLRSQLTVAQRELAEARAELAAEKARLDWLEQQLDPGCYVTLNHRRFPSEFFGEPPVQWSESRPICIGDFSEVFGATIRETIDKNIACTTKPTQTR